MFANYQPQKAAPSGPKVSYVEQLLLQHGTPERVIEFLQGMRESNPVNARLDLQVFYNAMGREEESFEMSSQLFELAPQDPRVLFNRGWHLLKRGQLQKGMALLEYGRGLNTYGHAPLQSSRPLWMPGRGDGNRVLLVLEGGFGDEMIHFRFGKDLTEKHGCRVTVICHPALAGVFARQSWVAGIAQREAALGVYHESWLPGMSAALALGYEYKDISPAPYIEADPKKVKDWSSLLRTDKLKIGIRWAGSPQFEHQQLRRFPPDLLTQLSRMPELQLYSFQRDDNLVDLPKDIVDLAPHLKTWEDTAAALSHMDLVISSCTSVAHLSAALGKPTWIIVPALPYFTWASPGETSPWYESVTLIRQSRFGNWEDVRTQIQTKVTEYVRNSAAVRGTC
jgi:hypothetical protein